MPKDRHHTHGMSRARQVLRTLPCGVPRFFAAHGGEMAANFRTRGEIFVLKLKPNCECCDRDPESIEAGICTLSVHSARPAPEPCFAAFFPTAEASSCAVRPGLRQCWRNIRP